jgi:hypothetical protein
MSCSISGTDQLLSNRQASDVMYLEQAYPRPGYLLRVAFALHSVLLSFNSIDCIDNCFYLLLGAISQLLFKVRGYQSSYL